jgi:hypothetical protein
MLNASDPCEKIANIVGSLDIGNIFDLTDFHKCFIAFIILRFWLNIWVIPKTYHIIFITQLEYWHGDIWTTADMDEDFWFFRRLWSIETVFEDISGDLIRKATNDKFRIFFKKCLEGGMLWDDFPDFCRRYIWDMRIREEFIV